MANQKLVVIGGDAAGMSAASLAKRRRPDVEVLVFEMGDYTSYGACGMPYHVEGLIDDIDDLVVVWPEEFREKRGIEIKMRHRVESLDTTRRTVVARDLESERTVEASYDDLLIATGAAPLVPPGIDLDVEGVFALRGLPDAAGVRRHIENNAPRSGLIVGSGYIGLEMAEALSAQGLEVTVVDLADRPMALYEPEISESIQAELDGRGVRTVFGRAVQELKRSDGGKITADLADGEALTADLAVVGTGVRPRSELAEAAGIRLGVKKAVSVDRRQQTSTPHVWAAGDCAEAYHRLLDQNAYVPLALTANRAGRVAGNNIVGIDAQFPGILGSAVCKVFDLAVARTGLGLEEAQQAGLDVEKVQIVGQSRPHYYPGAAQIKTILIVERKTKKLWGAQMAGTDGVGQRINIFAACLAAGMTLDQVHAMDLAYAPPFSPTWDPVLIAAEVAMKKVK
jgi:NADPH-dependent 2,4-dienoyl-CoA reductase/sulfur reductase-like enzyme